MQALDEQAVSCPYCGEIITVLIDPQQVDSQYIEDCQVCCRPIVFNVYDDQQGDIQVTLSAEDDAY